MDELVLHLKNLGFTDLEAKCLQVLAVSGTHTGYEIAKQLGVSRSNVYAALQKLAEKGAVLTSHGEPTVYQSVPIEEIGQRLEASLQASLQYVKAHLPQQETHRSEFYSLDGDAKVIERIRAELRKAKEEALCDLWPEEAKLLRDDLRQAQVRGVRVVVVNSREAGAGSFHPFARKRDDASALPRATGRKFTLLLDRTQAIVGTRGGEEPSVAMLTEHAAMIELLFHHVCACTVLQDLQQDMGTKLEDKYGKQFKKIIQKQIDGKSGEPKAEEKLKAAVLAPGGESGGPLPASEPPPEGKAKAPDDKSVSGKRKKKK